MNCFAGSVAAPVIVATTFVNGAAVALAAQSWARGVSRGRAR